MFRRTGFCSFSGFLIAALLIMPVSIVCNGDGGESRRRMPAINKLNSLNMQAVVEMNREETLIQEESELMSWLDDVMSNLLNNPLYHMKRIDWSIIWPALRQSELFSLDEFMLVTDSYGREDGVMSLLSYLGKLEQKSRENKNKFGSPYALLFLAVVSQHGYYEYMKRENPNILLYEKWMSSVKRFSEGGVLDIELMKRLVKKWTPFYSEIDKNNERLGFYLHLQEGGLSDVYTMNNPGSLGFAFETKFMDELGEPGKCLACDVFSRLGGKGSASIGGMIKSGLEVWKGGVDIRFKFVSFMLDQQSLDEYSPYCDIHTDEDCVEVDGKEIIKLNIESGLKSYISANLKKADYIELAWYHWKIMPEMEGVCESESCRKNHRVREKSVNDQWKVDHRMPNTQDLSDRKIEGGPEVNTLLNILMNHGVDWESLLIDIGFGKGEVHSISANSHYGGGPVLYNRIRMVIQKISDADLRFEDLCQSLHRLGMYSAESIIRQCLVDYNGLSKCPVR